MHVARLADRERNWLHLTRDDYNALRFENYTWVLDGFVDPPVCRRSGATVTLKPLEFQALAKLVGNPGVPMAPRRELFDGEAASIEAAVRRFEMARKKVEPQRGRGGGAFRTVGTGDDKRYMFQPGTELSYCVVERLESPLPVSPIAAWGKGVPTVQQGSWRPPDISALLQSLNCPSQTQQETPSPPQYRLVPNPTPAVEGVRVRVQRFRVIGRYVRAQVKVSNTTAEPKVVAYFTLHAGERSVRAVRPPRRRSALSAYSLDAEMLVLRSRVARVGYLLFPQPLVAGEAEATVRPHGDGSLRVDQGSGGLVGVMVMRPARSSQRG